MKKSKWGKYFLAVIVLFALSTNLYATARQDIECSLASARKDLRISIAMEERIASDLAKLKESGDETPAVIEDYERYLSRVKAMVGENRRVVAELEAVSATYDTRKASDGSADKDDTAAMVEPLIPEEQGGDEVAMLDRQLDRSLAEFDEMLLKELDLILAKSSKRKQDLADEAAAAVERLREKGIEIDTDFEEESADAGQGSTEEQKKGEAGKGSAEKEGDGSETGEKMKAEEGKDDTGLTGRDKSRGGVDEDTGSHPRNRFDPKDDDIVARQLREAAEGETDPELREKIWKEYELYKKNQSR